MKGINVEDFDNLKDKLKKQFFVDPKLSKSNRPITDALELLFTELASYLIAHGILKKEIK